MGPRAARVARPKIGEHVTVPLAEGTVTHHPLDLAPERAQFLGQTRPVARAADAPEVKIGAPFQRWRETVQSSPRVRTLRQ